MAEYINREEVLQILANRNAPWNGYLKCMELPIADVQPVVHGEWKPKILFDGFGDYPIFVCSECGNESSRKWNFCRECGAKMEGVKE